jgi:REP element-mobilizing transposase RayT
MELPATALERALGLKGKIRLDIDLVISRERGRGSVEPARDRRRRRSIRLQGYDYRQAGAYFVTICSTGRECFFGEIIDGQAVLSEVGRVVQETWDELPEHCPEVELDASVVMPNHLHGIIIVTGERGARHAVPLPMSPTAGSVFGKPLAGSLATFVRSFKSAASRRIHDLLGSQGRPIWQRGFYEHVVRNEAALDRIRRYIVESPLRWANDAENPLRR